MAQSTLSSYFKLYNFGSGRRLFAVREVRKRAQERGLNDLVALCDEALDVDRETAKLERHWRKAKTIKEGARTNAAQTDNELDRVVGALLTQLRSEATAFAGTPRGEAADKLIGELFPDGAATIIHASYENELSIVEDMVRALKGDLAGEVAGLHIEHYVTRLEVLTSKFRDALATEKTREVSFDQVREARQRGQEAMLRVLVHALATFSSDSEADVAARHDLLAPIISQNRRIGDYYSRRRPIPDVDPESGAEIIEPPVDDDQPVDLPVEDVDEPVVDDTEPEFA